MKVTSKLVGISDEDLETIIDANRVIIIEGVSGSGKDVFQKRVERLLAGERLVSFSEGDLLLGWNQILVGGMWHHQIAWMQRMVEHVAVDTDRDLQTTFLFNRLHLSTYAMADRLGPRFHETVSLLRTMDAHIFLLLLSDDEIEAASRHSERGPAWNDFRVDILKRSHFSDHKARLTYQQQLMSRGAKGFGIPYTVIGGNPE